ncbi:HlyD family secretion protein [Sphingobium sp. JS3065]|uniref:HlyD family efflux transporter periplasmic adaptor subunit n=1 Tax=Sphingobium sp. JS3065 TaxID=2970925 RepID=UPI0022651D73|nr:HlyD family efflux transporter periplasmic adaptor subunit [Sphingobium sp. JS3065]UZW56993.1 HlyD family secretion protein [Sphingobium sp. JS3065]
MIAVQRLLRARYARILLATGLIGIGTMGFAPYILNDVSTQAAINAPLIRLTAASDGTVANLPADGRYFDRTTAITLLNLSQDTGQVADLKAEAELAQTEMALSQRQLAELNGQTQRLTQRAALFSGAMGARLTADRDAAQADLAGCRAERAEQAANLARTRTLAAQGFISPAGVQKAEAAASLKNSNCVSAAARLQAIQVTRTAAQSDVFVGDSYNDAPYAVQQADRLLLQRQMVEKTLSDATARYRQASLRLKDALARAGYRAPAGTLVWAATASPGAAIRAGEPVLDLLDCRRRFVQVALPERKAEVIGPGTPADVRMIGSDQWLKGRVVNITGAASRRKEELLAASNYSLPEDREIMVDVALPAPEPRRMDGARKCDVGRLAEVRFSRRL